MESGFEPRRSDSEPAALVTTRNVTSVSPDLFHPEMHNLVTMFADSEETLKILLHLQYT